MKPTASLFAILLATVATVTLVQTVAISLSSTQINEKAKQFTVRIDGSEAAPKGNGSGSIIGRNGNIYKVLTNWHVVSQSNNLKDYTIQTSDGHTHRVKAIQRLNGADLAIITFESSQNYTLAKLGDSQTLIEGQTIHYAGYPASKPRGYQFYSNQNINGFLPQSAVENGYGLIFTGTALPGMSGSPLLDDNGDIIGIYGRSEQNLAGGVSLYGIPINTAKQLAQQQGIDLITSVTQSTSNSQQINTLISSTTTVNYAKLRNLLAAGKFKEADDETTMAMLQAVGKEIEGFFNPEDIDQFPCEDLLIIDNLWLNYSKKKFGFSVQKDIYLSVVGAGRNYDDIWKNFADLVGWRKGGNWLRENSDLTFDINAPSGHLPSPFFPIFSYGKQIFSRIKTCNVVVQHVFE